jgi:hypothetical protein
MERIMMDPAPKGKARYSDDFVPKSKRRFFSTRNIVVMTVAACLILVIGLLSYASLAGRKSFVGQTVLDVVEQKGQATAGTGGAEGAGSTSQLNAEARVNSTGIINNIIMLRQYSNANDLVMTAEGVSKINKEIESFDIAELRSAWRNVIDCVYEKCADGSYLNMIDAVAMMEIDNRNNAAIHSLVETCKLWNGKNQLYFSDSLSETNKLLKELNNKKVDSEWKSLVSCNGQCPEFSDLSVELILAINGA